MERVIKIKDVLNETKYVFKEEYKGIGIYNEKTPVGYEVYQSWLLNKPGRYPIIIQSYNNKCIEELYDVIDNYNKNGKFGLRVMNGENCCYAHPNGTEII